MKYRNYKSLLEEINKEKEIILTISLWTYSSGRMVFTVPFNQIKECLDGDMLFKYNEQKLKFIHKEKPFSFKLNTLKISKVDHIEIK